MASSISPRLLQKTVPLPKPKTPQDHSLIFHQSMPVPSTKTESLYSASFIHAPLPSLKHVVSVYIIHS